MRKASMRKLFNLPLFSEFYSSLSEEKKTYYSFFLSDLLRDYLKFIRANYPEFYQISEKEVYSKFPKFNKEVGI